MYAHIALKAIKCMNVRQAKKIIDVLIASTTISTTKKQVNVNHSSIDKSCGCYKAVLKKDTEVGLLKWIIA